MLPLLVARSRIQADRLEGERLRAETVAQLPRIADCLRSLGATEAIVFGSIVSGDFSSDSDLDILVSGLDGESLLRARGQILGFAHVPIDLVVAESAPVGLIRNAGTAGWRLDVT